MSIEYTNGNINGNTNENKNGKTNGNTNGIINGAKYAKLYDSRRFITNNLVNKLEEKLTASKLEQFKINKIIENAIHWCLVNGRLLNILNFLFFYNFSRICSCT